LPTYRNPHPVHCTNGPSRPLDSRTNRGFAAPHTSQETYGFEFSIQPVDPAVGDDVPFIMAANCANSTK